MPTSSMGRVLSSGASIAGTLLALRVRKKALVAAAAGGSDSLHGASSRLIINPTAGLHFTSTRRRMNRIDAQAFECINTMSWPRRLDPSTTGLLAGLTPNSGRRLRWID
jgi:hypothetical protein